MTEWTQWAVALLGAGGIGSAVTALIKTRPIMRTVELKGEAALWTEIHVMQTQAKDAKDDCDARIERLTRDSEQRIERLTKRYESALSKAEAETQIARHDRNNTRGALNAFLMMVKRLDNPELSSIAEAVEEMIVRGEQALAIEKAAIPVMKGGEL